jgi:hypothetical protein
MPEHRQRLAAPTHHSRLVCSRNNVLKRLPTGVGGKGGQQESRWDQSTAAGGRTKPTHHAEGGGGGAGPHRFLPRKLPLGFDLRRGDHLHADSTGLTLAQVLAVWWHTHVPLTIAGAAARLEPCLLSHAHGSRVEWRGGHGERGNVLHYKAGAQGVGADGGGTGASRQSFMRKRAPTVKLRLNTGPAASVHSSNAVRSCSGLLHTEEGGTRQMRGGASR